MPRHTIVLKVEVEKLLNEYRKAQDEIPSLSYAINRLIKLGYMKAKETREA